MLHKEIHFEGDEDWKFNSKVKIENFFYGWFKGKKGKLLEAGSGIGNYVVIFSKFGFKTTGIEYDKKRVALSNKNCKKYGVKARIVQGDVRKTPFKNGEFDLVFSHGVVEHVPDTDKALKELSRVLKKEGYAMISVPNRVTSFTLSKILQQVIGKLIGKDIWKCGYEQSFMKTKFRKMLGKAGFKVVDEEVTENSPGRRFPVVGKILRMLDKPLLLFGAGGHFNLFWCRKIA